MNLMSISDGELQQSREKVKVCVIGLGRIGLPLAASLAGAGYQVIGYDINENVVSKLNSSESHIKDEPGLEELVKKVVDAKKLHATTDEKVISSGDVVIICVPTPVDEANHPNYVYLSKASESVAKNFQKGSLVIIESTVGPGTVENFIIPILEKSSLKAGKDFGVVAAPERANPGEVLKNLHEDYKILGGIDEKSTKLAAEFYSAMNKKIFTLESPKTANAIKLTENIYRGVNISLMNELAILYEKLGIDILEVIKACSTKWNFLPHYPGPGVGGPCLPANPYYLIEEALKVKYVPNLIRLADEINSRMPQHVVELISKVMNNVNKTIHGSNITILGLAYKANVADTQFSPSGEVIKGLLQLGASIKAYDPYMSGNIFDVNASESLQDAVKNSECLVFMVDHDQFKNFDLNSVKHQVSNPCTVVDCKGIFSPKSVKELGFNYIGIGRV